MLDAARCPCWLAQVERHLAARTAFACDGTLHDSMEAPQ
jgi:hypothetical protein